MGAPPTDYHRSLLTALRFLNIRDSMNAVITNNYCLAIILFVRRDTP